MSNPKTLEAEWEEFKAQIIPPNATLLQRNEMKKAFFGGVMALLSLQQDLADSSDPKEVADGVVRWIGEVDAFADKLSTDYTEL
jgi:hypothetical protein